MSGFERLKIYLHDELNRLSQMTQNQGTQAKIYAIQQAIARLEEF